MIGEYFHRRFRIWIVGWLEAKIVDSFENNSIKWFILDEITAFPEEFSEQSNHMGQRQIPFGHDSFDLMEFGQMCGIQSFIAENSINAEHFGRFETLKMWNIFKIETYFGIHFVQANKVDGPKRRLCAFEANSFGPPPISNHIDS